jgi:hypothetical protein
LFFYIIGMFYIILGAKLCSEEHNDSMINELHKLRSV